MSNSTSTALSSGTVGAPVDATTDAKPAKAARKGDNSKQVRDVAAIMSAEDIRKGVSDLMQMIDDADKTIAFAGQRLSYFIMCQHAVDTANATKRVPGPVALDKMYGEENGKQVRRPTFISYLQGIVAAFRNGAPRIGKPTDKLEVSEDGRDTFKIDDNADAAAFRKQQALYNRCSRALRLACILATHKVTPFDWNDATNMWLVPTSVIVPGGWTEVGSLAKQDKILLDDTQRWNVENLTNDTGKIYASVAQADYAFEHRFDRAPAASKTEAAIAKRGARPSGNTTTAPVTSGTTTPVTTTTTVTPVIGATPTTGSVGNLPSEAPKNLPSLVNVLKSNMLTLARTINISGFTLRLSDLSPEEQVACRDVLRGLQNLIHGTGMGLAAIETPPAKTAAKGSK